MSVKSLVEKFETRIRSMGQEPTAEAVTILREVEDHIKAEIEDRVKAEIEAFKEFLEKELAVIKPGEHKDVTTEATALGQATTTK